MIFVVVVVVLLHQFKTQPLIYTNFYQHHLPAIAQSIGIEMLAIIIIIFFFATEYFCSNGRRIHSYDIYK